MAFDFKSVSMAARAREEAQKNLQKNKKKKKNYVKTTDYSKSKPKAKKVTVQKNSTQLTMINSDTRNTLNKANTWSNEHYNQRQKNKEQTKEKTKAKKNTRTNTNFNIVDSNTRKTLNKVNKTNNNTYKKKQEENKKKKNSTQLTTINSDTRNTLNKLNKKANQDYSERKEIKKYGTLEGKSNVDSTNFNIAKRISEINDKLNRYNSNNTLNTHESTIPKHIQRSVKSEMTALQSEKMNLELQLKKAGYNPRKVVENYSENARIEQMKKDEQALAQKSKEHPIAMSIASVLTQPAEIMGAVKTASNWFTGQEMNEYDKAYTGSRTNQAIRGTIAQQVNESLGGGTLGFLGSTAYQAGMSVVDFLTMAKLPTRAITTVFGMKSASAGAMKTLERGGSVEDAFQVGLVNGISEAVWEKVSIDNFKQLASMPVKGVKNVVKNIVKQMGIEAEEESATELSNIIFESLVSYNTSDYHNYYMEGRKNGLTDEQASYYAFRKAGGQILEAGLSGMFAGLGTGAGASIIGNVSGSFVSEEEYQKSQTNILHNGVINQEVFLNRINEKVQELVQAKRQANGINSTENITDVEAESVKAQAIDEVIQEVEIMAQEQPLSEVERIAQENNIPIDQVEETIENARTIARSEERQDVGSLKSLAETLAGVEYVEDYNNSNKEDLNVERNFHASQTMNSNEIENPLRASATTKIKGVDSDVYVIGVNPKLSSNGELKLITRNENDKEQSINLSEIQFENEAIEELYSVANDIAQEYGINGAKAFVEGFANSDIDFNTYEKVFNDFYLVGGNMQKSFALTKQQSLYGEMSNIDNSVLKAIWTAGMLDSKSRVENAQRKVNKVKKEQKNMPVKNKKYGIVTEYNENISKKISKDLYTLIDIVSKPLNVKVEIVEDATQNGYYNKETGTITLSLNSENPMLTLFSHETLHHLKQISPKAYQTFENAVINYMQINHAQEFKDRLDQYRNNYYKAIDNGTINLEKSKITDKYLYEEVVANTVGLFFNDEQAISEYVNTHNKESKSLLEAIKETLKSILNALKKVKPKTVEERLLLKSKKDFEKFQKMFWTLMDEGAKAKVDLTTETTEYKSVDEIPDSEIPFSLKEDSEGKELSPKQIEFFKDSKITNSKGNLKILYHGTGYDFTVFDVDSAGKNYGGWSAYGKGIYLATKKRDAEVWRDKSRGRKSNIMTVYANITNPFDIYESYAGKLDELQKEYNLDDLTLKQGYRIIDYLNENGYDSTEVLKEYGFDGIDADSEVIAFNPNQIKNIDNLNPTSENDDIRYSMNELRNSITEDTVNIDKLQSENNTLKQTIKQLRLTYGATRGKLKDAGSIERLAKNILKETKSKYGEEELTKKLKTLFTFLDKNQSILWDDAVDITAGLMKEVLQQSEVLNKDLYNDYKPLIEQMKKTGISLSEDAINEVTARYGSMKEFRKAAAGLVKITKEKALNLDSIWSELHSQYPELFDIDINELDQPLILLTTLKALQPTYENPYDLNIDEASLDLAFETYKKYLELPRFPKLTETDEKALEVATEKAEQQAIIDARKKFDKLLEQNRKENKEKVENTVKKLEEYYLAKNKKVADKKEQAILKQFAKTQELTAEVKGLKAEIKAIRKGHLKELTKAEKETRKKVRAEHETKRHIKGILRLKNEFEKIFMATSGKDFIPTKLREGILGLCEAVSKNIDGENSQAVIRQLKKMQKHYRELELANSNFLRVAFDVNILENLEELTTMLDSKQVFTMSAEEIKKVYELLGIMKYNLTQANKLIFATEEADANHYMNECHEEINSVKGVKRNLLARAKNKYGSITLDSVTAFKRMVNFAKNSSWVRLAEDLRQGEITQNNTMMEGMDIFNPVMDGKGFKKAKKLVSGKWVDVGLRTERKLNEDTGQYELIGKSVPIPRSMLISLYLMNQNEQNKRHMLEGGLEVPNMKDYKDGKVAEAFAGKTRAYVTEEVLLEAFNTLTDFEKQVINLTHKFFNDFARNKINEVSVQLNGYVKATVDNYFPINASEDFIKPNMDTLLKDATIEGVGTFKHRTNDNKAIYLEDVFEVVQRHLKTVSKYYGLAIPLRNFSRVYGQVSETGEAPFENSLNRAIGQKWGVTGKEYIKNLIIDYNFGRIAEPSIFDKLRSNLATSALVLNLSTAVKQVSSYPASAYTLGWTPLIKALVSTGKYHMPIGPTDKAEIRKYTRIYDYRNMGNSTQEIGELSHNKNWNEKHPYLFGWIQVMDSATQGRMWSACKYYVNTHNKDLAKGSQAYFEEVARVFEKTLTTTQSTFTTSQRPAILRTDNTMMKAMTMFMTENLKNYSIMYDSFGELGARSRDYRRNKTKENKKDLVQARKNFANAMSGQLAQALLFASLTFLGNLLLYRLDDYRDDEEGEITKEKIIEEIAQDGLNSIFASFLWGGEIYETIDTLLEKKYTYDIELSGFSLINDFIQAGAGIVTEVWDFKDEMKESGKTIEDYTTEDIFNIFKKKMLKLGTTAASLIGIPAKNVYNMLSSGHKYITDFNNDELGTYEIGVKRSNDQVSARISKMLLNGEHSKAKTYIDKLIKDGTYTSKKLDDIIKYYLADYDSKIAKAAEYLREGNATEYKNIVKEYKDLGFKQDVVVSAINLFNSRFNKNQESKDDKEVVETSYDTTDEEEYLFSYTDLTKTLENLDEENALTIRDDIYDGYIRKNETEGKEYTDKQIYQYMKSSITKNFKKIYLTWYENGEHDKMNQAKYILINDFGYDPKVINYWWIEDYKDGYLENN